MLVSGVFDRPATGTGRERVFKPLGIDDAFVKPTSHCSVRIARPRREIPTRKSMVESRGLSFSSFRTGPHPRAGSRWKRISQLVVSPAMRGSLRQRSGRRTDPRLYDGSPDLLSTEPSKRRGATTRWGSKRSDWVAASREVDGASFCSARQRILRSHGFTGVSVWVDAERDLAMTLLTIGFIPRCRAHDPAVRKNFHAAVLKAWDGS